MRPLFAMTLLFSVTLVVGCSSKAKEQEKLPTQPARGIVKYKGKPVGNGSVSCQSLDGKVIAWGVTDGVGSFELSTYGTKDGIPPGKYRVTVGENHAKEIEPGVLEPEPEGGWKSTLPTKYANPKT